MTNPIAAIFIQHTPLKKDIPAALLLRGTSGDRNASLVVSRMDPVRPRQPTSTATYCSLLVGRCTILVKPVHPGTKIRKAAEKEPHLYY